MKYIVYIDDTGTPSLQSKSKYDPGDWHSHVAVFIELSKAEELSIQILALFEKYKILNDFDEFHFIRILSGKDGWRNVEITKRLEIFEDFASLYHRYKFPILIQSFTSDDIIRNKMDDLIKLKIPHFDLSNLSHLTLFFLLFRIKDFVLEGQFELPTEIKVDTGKGKHSGRNVVPILSGITQNSEIEFVDSKKDVIMQFADFIAFCLNRMLWIIMAENKGSLDIRLLQIISEANFQVKNGKQIFVDAHEVKARDYDKELRKTYDSNENLSDSDVEQIKKEKSKDN